MRALDTGSIEAPVSSRLPAGREIAWSRRARRLMWFGLALALIALPFLSLPGRYVNDTRDALWLAPHAYLSHVLQLWHGSPFLGFEQHDGIVFPMALTIWALRALGLSAWVAERLWHGVLLFAAAAFTILLVDHLRGRRTVAAPLLAGLIYALTPFTFGYGIPFTGTFLAYVALPLLVLIVLVGVERPGLVWPAIFGLATLLMGGGNGAPQVYALLTCSLLLGWIAFVDRDLTVGRVLGFGALSLLFVVGLNAYWLFLLGSGEIRNALQYSEAPRVINVDSSVAESIRGLGLWLFYGGDTAGPWVPAVRPFLASPLFVVVTFAVPAAAFAAAWRTRWRFRLFFVLLAVVSVFVVAGIFPVNASTPFGRLLGWSYTHIPGVGGLRTTYKFASAIELSLAVLVGMGVDPTLAALRRLRRPALVTPTAVAATFAVVAVIAYPLWSGHLYPERSSTGDIPAYWQRALSDLGRSEIGTRAFFAPAIDRATYHWGALKEGVVSAAPDLPAIAPIPLPVGERYGSNLLRAVQQPYFEGIDGEGSPVLFRYLGASSVVLQNDLDWHLTRTARPFAMQSLVRALGANGLRSYGSAGENVMDPAQQAPLDAFQRAEALLPPVQVLAVPDPLQIARAESGPPVVLSGDGFGIDTAATAGLLDGNPPLLYSAAMTPGQIAAAAAGGARFVITDSNRRRVWSFTSARGRASETLPAGRTIGLKQTGYGLFANRPDSQTVAVYPGLRAIRASTDAGQVGSAPQFRPSLAFDGDPGTWWLASAPGDPVGSWIEADLTRPKTVSALTISQPAATASRPIDRVRIGLSTGTRLTASLRRGEPTLIRFPPTRVDRIRVTIEHVAPAAESTRSPAIADIAIPGIDPAEIIRTPTDLLDTVRSTPGGLASLAGAPLTYLFERARTGSPGDHDEEAGIARRFALPGPMRFVFAGTAHLDTSAPDERIDRSLYGPLPITLTSSSRKGGDLRVRASAAFDGNPATVWEPDGAVGQWIAARFPARRIGSIAVLTDLRPGREPITGMRARFSDGTVLKGRPLSSDGVIRFAFTPRRVSSVELTVDSVYAPGRVRSPSVAIREISISGVSVPKLSPDAPLPCDTTSSRLDGSPLFLRVDGTVADALAHKEMSIETCHGSAVALGAGSHDLRIGGGLQPDIVSLRSPGIGPASSPPAPPALSWTSPADGRYELRVRGAARPFYAVIGQNFGPNWHASIGGHDLGPPVLLDGYSAGWYVTRAGSFTISVRYGPQRLYSIALAVSGISLVIAMAIAVAGVLRNRRRRRAG